MYKQINLRSQNSAIERLATLVSEISLIINFFCHAKLKKRLQRSGAKCLIRDAESSILNVVSFCSVVDLAKK